MPGVVGSADAHRRVQLAGRDPRPRGRARRRSADPPLSGVVVGDVRQGPRGAADARRRRSIRAVRTASRRCSRTTSRSTIARATGCSRSPASSSITSRRGAASSSSRARSPTASRGSSSASPSELRLGNLDAQRDWGFAGDYVRAMWLMLQQDAADDYVDRDRREPLGAGAGRDRVRPRRPRLAEIRQSRIRRFLRPAEVDHLIGDASKAAAKFGWTPTVSFEQPRQDDGGRGSCKGLGVSSWRAQGLGTSVTGSSRPT